MSGQAGMGDVLERNKQSQNRSQTVRLLISDSQELQKRVFWAQIGPKPQTPLLSIRPRYQDTLIPRFRSPDVHWALQIYQDPCSSPSSPVCSSSSSTAVACHLATLGAPHSPPLFALVSFPSIPSTTPQAFPQIYSTRPMEATEKNKNNKGAVDLGSSTTPTTRP
ncbi:hypothetical protein LY78DRAFT_489116 [Colletotrichum sublineola]|nr:hypothetical protein LY78DRAFT_489116 [Colletotrichum sublineola]